MVATEPMRLVEQMTERAIIALRRDAGDAPLSIFIDPTLADPLGDLLKLNNGPSDSLHCSAARAVRLPHMHDDFNPECHPYLLWLPCEEQAERIVNAALRVAICEALGAYGTAHQARSVCGIILGDAEPIRTAKRLAATARVMRPDGAWWYLRFWDPRVLWHLPRMLPAPLWDTIARGIGPWCTFDLRQEWVTGNRAPHEVPPGVTETPMRLSQPVWDRLARIGPMNQVLAMARDWGLGLSPALAERIERLLREAAEFGYPADGDGIVFAAAGITAHEQFYRHPQVAQTLQRAADEGRPLGDALSGLDEAFWADVSSGRWLAEPNNK